MEMDQIEEFDSTSSSSSASSASESSSNESSGEEEEGGSSFGEAGEGDVSDSQDDNSASEIGLSLAGGAIGGSSIKAESHGGPRSSYRAEKSLEATEAAGGRRRKRLRKRKATGLRKKLRTHIESVDEFNPEARSAQSAELERLRRLQLQQSLTASIGQHQSAVAPQALVVAPTMYAGQIQPHAVSNISVPSSASQQIYTSPMQEASVAGSLRVQLSSSAQGVATTPSDGVNVTRRRSDSSSSPEVLMVDLTYTAKMGDPQRRAEDAIVIDSGSDSDNTGNNSNKQGCPQVIAKQQISGRGEVASVVPVTNQVGSSGASVTMPTRSELLNMKYGEILPSPDGRVLVNAGHASSEEDIYLAPQIARAVKPHQIGGIRFLYDNIVETLTRFNSSPGFGCILAHSMGLGKTLQVIGFIEVFFRCTPAKHVLCVVPVNTLQNWIGEFEHWVPPPPPTSATQSNRSSSSSASGVALLTNQNPLWGQVTTLATKTTPLAMTTSSTPGGQSRTDEVRYRSFNISILSEANRTMDSRLKVIREWRSVGGVLLLGYEMYRLLSLSVPSLGGNKMAVKKKKSLVVKAPAGGTIDLDETEREMEALIEIQKALCNPGPDLVVCDEGHRIKNDYSNISQALKRIRTRRRIVMTGYPLQNNLTEYWCMVDFVRPNLLGTKQEFADLFERPITNGQCVDSTPMDVRLMRYRSHVLHSLLEGFVLRKGHEILKSTLPPKFEHVLYLRPSQVQADLYNFNMSAIAQAAGNSNSAGPLKAFAVCSKIWNHPDIYYQEAMTQKRSKTISPTSWLDHEGLPKTLLSGSTSTSGAKGSSSESTCRIDWPSSDIPNYQPGVLENSPKMVILAELVDRSVHLGDKILIFSQSLNTLSYIEKLLSQRQIPISSSTNLTGPIQYSNLKWTKNKNYCRLDGSTNSIERDRLINNFNAASNHDCWVFLLSTKAGCLGINLIGANRVIVTDVSWNPCYDSQAVCRVYRYGQTKPCYIYRLVCDGTMERKIYDRQISKQSMSNRVVDELHPERHLTSQDILKLITPLAQLPPPSDLSPRAMEYLFDPLLMEICSSHGKLLTKLPFKHESLLLDSEEERMTEVEKYIAMKGFQQHLKLIRSNPNNQQSGQGGGGYRPQPTGQTSLPRPQASQVRPQAGQARLQTGQARPQTGQAGQERSTQQGSRPFPQIPGLQVPIPPVPEATPSTSGMIKRGSMIKTPNEKVEVICLDSDEDENGDNRPVAVTRGEIPLVAAANDPISLLQSPTHLQSPSLSSQFSSAAQAACTNNDPLPAASATAVTSDPLPASTSAETPPTSSTHTDSSSALNLNMSFNNSIPPWIDMLMAVTEDVQQRNLLLHAANLYLQETSSYSHPVASATSPTDDSMMMGQSSQVVPDVAANVNVFSDVATCAALQSFIQVQGSTCQQMNDGEIATSSNSVVPLSSPPPLTSSMSPPPTVFQSQQTQVYGNAAPHSSLPTSNGMMSSTPIVTSSVSSGVSPLPVLCSQSQMSQVQVKLEHSSSSLSPCESPPPPSNTFHANKSPCVSPVAQSSPSRYTSSPSSSSSSSLSPLSPHHQTQQSPINKTPESSNTCTPSLLSVNVLTCSSSCSTQSTDSLKLKRSKSHSAPVRHLAPSPLRKTQSSSPPKSYSLSQKFNSSLLNDDSSTTGARSTSVSPTSNLSPSQSNSSDCSSPPEQPSKPQNQSPPTRSDSSVTFRYSSSPSPSNTPSAPYTPSSIPLLSPVAARLLFLSTGTRLPSSPPEDVDKLPPIINRKPITTSRSLDSIKKEGHGCTTNLASVVKKESGSSAQSLLLNNAEKKHHSDKKKRKGSSLAKSMELVPMSTDITPESFFTSNQMTSASVTTPTSVSPPAHPAPHLLTSLPQVRASSSCVTTPSPVDPPPMQCTPLPLRRNSCDSLKKDLSSPTTAAAVVSPKTTTTVANLWALKFQPQLVNHQPVAVSHVCSTEQLLSNIFTVTSSSKSLTAVPSQSSPSTVVSCKGVSGAPVSRRDPILSTGAAQGSVWSVSTQHTTFPTYTAALATAQVPTMSTAIGTTVQVPTMSTAIGTTAQVPTMSTAIGTTAQVPTMSTAIGTTAQVPTLSNIMLSAAQGSSLSTVPVPARYPTSSTGPVSTSSTIQSTSLVPPLTSTPAKSLALSSRGTTLSTVSFTKVSTASITHSPTPSTVVGPSRGSVLPNAAVYKTLSVSAPSSKTTLPMWSNASQQCSTLQSMSSTPVAGVALSSLSLSRNGAVQPREVLLSHLSSVSPSSVLSSVSPSSVLSGVSPSSVLSNVSPVVSSTTLTARVSKAQCTLSPAPSQAYTTLPLQVTASSSAQSVSQNITHRGVTSPILSAVLSGTSTSVSTAFALPNAMLSSQVSLSSAQQQTVVQHCCSNGVTSPTLSSVYSMGVPDTSKSYLGTSEAKTSHAQNHHPAMSVSMTTAVGVASIPPTNTIQSSVQNSAQDAPQSASCSAPTTLASSSSAVGGMFVVDESATVLGNLPPEGLEHRVVSGLLQAEPPVTLNKIQDSVHKPGVKSEVPASAASATPGGYGVVTNGGVAHAAISSASCGRMPRMRNSSSSSSCDSNPPLLPPVSVNSSKPLNTSPPSYTKNMTTGQSNQKLVAVKPSPPPQRPPLSSTAHSVEVIRPSTLTVSSTQATSSVLPSPTVVISTNQLPSLNSRRNSSSLEMPMGDNSTSQTNMTAVNMNDFLNSECVGTLILSPTQLLSPSSLQSPPGSTTLPDPLKTFIFPISLSPPIERRQVPTSSAQNSFSALQNTMIAPQEQHQREQKQLPIRGSLMSPDHCHRNSPVLPTNRQQSQEPLLSPAHQRSNPVAPDRQGNNAFIQQRNSPVVAQDVQKGVPSLSPTQHRSSPVVVAPNLQKNGSFVQRRNSSVLAPSPHKSGPRFSGNPQRNSPNVASNIIPKSSPLLSPTQQRSSPVFAPDLQKRGTSIAGGRQRSSPNSASNPQGSSSLLSPTKLEQRSSPVLAPDLQKCGASIAGGQHRMSSSSPVTVCSSQRSTAPKPQQKISPVVVPTAQRNGWDVIQSLMLSPDCQRSSTAPSQSNQQRGSTISSPNTQRNSTVVPSFDKKSHHNDSVSPGSQMNHLLALSPANQRGSPVVSSTQQRNNIMLLPPVDCSGRPPAETRNRALLSPTTPVGNYSMPLSAQQRSTNVISQMPDAVRAPSSNLDSFSIINSGGPLPDNPLSLSAQVSKPVPSSNHRRRSSTVLPSPSQISISPSVPPVSNGSDTSLSPTLLTNPVPFTNQQAGSAMLLSPNSQMSIHGTSSDGTKLFSPTSQGSGSVPSTGSQQKSGTASRRKGVSSDHPRNGTKVSPELQRSGPSLSQKSQQVSPVVVPNTQKKTGGKSSTDKKKTKHRKPSSDHQKRNTVQSSNNQGSGSNSQPTAASNINQRSNTPLLASLNSQINGSAMPLNHQRSGTVFTSSPPELQGSKAAPLSSHQSGTLPVSLPSCQRSSTVVQSGNNPLLSPDYLKHSTVPSSSNRNCNAALPLPNSQKTGAMLPPILSHDAQKCSAFPSANNHRNSAAVSLSNAQRNGTVLVPSFSSGQALNAALPSSNCQMSSPSTLQALPSYQSATASLHRASPALVNAQQKPSSTKPTYTSLNVTNSGNGPSIPHSVPVTISNRLPPSPHTNSPIPGAISNVLASPVQSTPLTFAAMTARSNDPTLVSVNGLTSAICPASCTSSFAPVTVSGVFTSTPQSNVVTNSNKLDSTPHLTSTPAVGSSMSPVLQHPQTSKSSPSQQEEWLLLQNGSMSSVSPSWDTTLSLLSDIFAPQPSSQGQRQHGENSLAGQAQASVALPSMDGDQLINELLGNSQSQKFMSNHPQASVCLPNANDDANSIINDLLSSSQNQNLVPKCPQTSVNQQSMGKGQVMKELLSSSRNPPPSQNASKKQLAVRPQSLVSDQRSNSSATHPLMRVSSPTMNGWLPQQQKNGPSLPKQRQNGPLMVQQQQKEPQSIHSWQQQSGSLQTQQQNCQQQQSGLLSQKSLLPQQQNGPLSQFQQSGPLPQHQQNVPVSQHQYDGPLSQCQRIDPSSQNHQNDQLSSWNHQSGPVSEQQQNTTLPLHQQNGTLAQHQLNASNGPVSQQQQNGTLPPQPQQNGTLMQHQLNASLPQQQQQNGPSSQDGIMLWQQLDPLSSNHTPCPQTHQATVVSGPHTNSSGLVQPISSNNLLQSSQLGGFQISPTSSTYSSETQGQLQQLLSPTQTGLPSLPKLTPLPSQPPMLGSHQGPPTVSTTQCPQVLSGPTGSQQVKQFGGCVPQTDDLMSKSVMAPQQSSTESTLNAQNSINLLSILNSLSPSQLESLLNNTTKDSQLSPVPGGNSRQGNKHPSSGDVVPAVPHSQTTLTNFPNQNFGSSTLPNLPIPHHSTPAANYRESLASHNAKPKVVQVNKTASSTALPQFTVRSSCTTTELTGRLLQLEPTALMQGYNSNATAGPVSALRLHSRQIN